MKSTSPALAAIKSLCEQIRADRTSTPPTDSERAAAVEAARKAIAANKGGAQ